MDKEISNLFLRKKIFPTLNKDLGSIAHSLSLSSKHNPDMTEILLSSNDQFQWP